MYNFLKLFVLGLLTLFCMGASRCNKEGPSDNDTTAKIGDELSDPTRPDGTLEGPEVPLIEDPLPGELVDREPGFAGFDDPSRDLFEPVYFGFDQSTLGGQERLKVERVASYLMSNNGATVIVEGHCDWKGTTEYNISLGERRASSVKQFLIVMGVPANRISVSSQGDLQATESGGNSSMAKDRKARFIVQTG